ncbi:MAG: hypothetical protein E7347_01410 [Clostridiales bacterium]|nr:hypothetical protein [Clostridiales bacterium]
MDGLINKKTNKKTNQQLINNISAFILAFCCMVPSFSGKTIIVLFAMFLWGASAMLGKYSRYVFNSNENYIYLGMFGWGLMTIAIILIRPQLNAGGLYTGLLTSVICIETFRNNLINRDFSIIKALAFFTVVLYVIVLVRALLIGGFNSDVYRLNKTSGLMNESIGNFGIYYLIVFTIPVGLFFSFKKNCKYRLLALALTLVSILLLFAAQYAIAFITEISLLLIWFVITKTKENKSLRLISLVFITLLIVLLVLFVDELLVSPLTSIANSLPSSSPMKERLMDVVKTLQGDVGDNNLAVDRLTRYKDSLVSFFKNPLFGSNFENLFSVVETEGKAGHNSVLEMLNQYGLVFGLPYFMLLISAFKKALNIWKNLNHSFYALLIAIIFAYFLLGLLNPIFNLFAMTWFLFNAIFVMPLVFDKKFTHGQCGEIG